MKTPHVGLPWMDENELLLNKVMRIGSSFQHIGHSIYIGRHCSFDVYSCCEVADMIQEHSRGREFFFRLSLTFLENSWPGQKTVNMS